MNYESALQHAGLTPDVRLHQLYLQGVAAGMAMQVAPSQYGSPELRASLAEPAPACWKHGDMIEVLNDACSSEEAKKRSTEH